MKSGGLVVVYEWGLISKIRSSEFEGGFISNALG